MSLLAHRLTHENNRGAPVFDPREIKTRLSIATEQLNKAEGCFKAFEDSVGGFKRAYWAKKVQPVASRARTMVENISVTSDAADDRNHIIQRTCDMLEAIAPCLKDS